MRGVYIIAEVGINHNGSLKNCYRLIDAAKDAGCDCVKFQLFRARNLYPRSAGTLEWKGEKGRYRYEIYDAVRSFEIPQEWIGYIMKYCEAVRINFLSSVFDAGGARHIARLGVKSIKLPSHAITNLPLIETCARTGCHIIISTGGSTLGEIEEAVNALKKYHNNFSLLHCSMKYPTALNECNLGVIKTLQYAFPDQKIGYSDHTMETSKAPVQAVYLGAEIIEKHITLDRGSKGPDHFFALEPRQLRKMVRDIRAAERRTAGGSGDIDKRLYGSSAKVLFDHERYLRDFCYTTIFAARDFKKGEVIKKKDLIILRPGNKKRGLGSKYLDLFKTYKIHASKRIKAEEPITWEKIFNA